VSLPARYVKIEPFDYTALRDSWVRFETFKDKYKLTFDILGLVLIFFGSFLLFTQLLFPKLKVLSKAGFIKPVSDGYFSELTARKDEFVFRELIKKQQEIKEIQESIREVPKDFFLTVPKLGIKKAVVETNSTNASPDEKLGHFRGSALPSEGGNVFIYGHSTLKVLFDSNNYKTIFAKLDELEFGDEVLIEYIDQSYRYVVGSLEVLNSDEVEPFVMTDIRGDSLTLMTCTPPGATTQRLLVHATKTF